MKPISIMSMCVFFLMGCFKPYRSTTILPIAEKNTDVIVLAKLIQNHLRNSGERSIDMETLLECDTLHRIAHRFEKVQLNNDKGGLSFYYKFSERRDTHSINLINDETNLLYLNRWNFEEIMEPFDGQISFSYGERFYQIVGISLNEVERY